MVVITTIAMDSISKVSISWQHLLNWKQLYVNLNCDYFIVQEIPNYKIHYINFNIQPTAVLSKFFLL